MFDFSLTGILLAFAMALWASFSPVTAAALAVALLAGILGTVSRSRTLRASLFGLAVASGAFAIAWQGAATEGARRELVHAHTLAVAAERERAELAEGITRELAGQSTRDLEKAQAGALNLKGLDDAMAKDGRRDGVCVDRSIARRLRAL